MLCISICICIWHIYIHDCICMYMYCMRVRVCICICICMCVCVIRLFEGLRSALGRCWAHSICIILHLGSHLGSTLQERASCMEKWADMIIVQR